MNSLTIQDHNGRWRRSSPRRRRRTVLGAWALRILDAEVTAGIGRAFTELLKLDQSYSGAREAVSYRVLYGTGRAINIGEIAPKEASGFEPNDDTNLRKLYKNIHLGEKAAIAQSVEEFIKELSVSATSVQQYKIAVMELASPTKLEGR